MSTSITAFRLFVASPGGLESEREAVRDEIARHNQGSMHDLGAAFSHEGYEDSPGGKRRAQERINEQVRHSDFMVVMLWDKWGSPPGNDGKFASGTEEEFRLAESLIAEASANMKDILVVFKGVPENQLGDPGAQLQKVIAFKKELEKSKEWFYKTFDNIDELRRVVHLQLDEWSSQSFGSNGRTSQQPPGDSPPMDDIDISSAGEALPLLERAEYFADRGMNSYAEAAYAEAVASEDLAAMESYATFLRRSGRLAKSLETSQDVVARLAALEPTPENRVRRSMAISTLGVTHRKMGNLLASRKALLEAGAEIRGGTPEENKSLAYSFDNLGLTEMRSGDLNAARRSFEKSAEARQGLDDDIARGRNLLNLARVEGRTGSTAAAISHCTQAIQLLFEDPAALAATYSMLGELQFKTNPEDAESAFRSALEINETSGHPTSISISLVQLGRVLLENGRTEDARTCAERALEESAAASSVETQLTARQLMGRVAHAVGDEDRAIALLEDAASGYHAVGNPTGEAWSLQHLADAQYSAGLAQAAAESRARASAIASTVQSVSLSQSLRTDPSEDGTGKP